MVNLARLWARKHQHVTFLFEIVSPSNHNSAKPGPFEMIRLPPGPI
jgi:hypothetical protein